MTKRERWNKVAEWDLSMQSIASFLGVSGEGATNLLSIVKKALDSRLSHEYYDARTILGQLQSKLITLYKSRDLMQRLESMSA